jgi:hypothetical protein
LSHIGSPTAFTAHARCEIPHDITRFNTINEVWRHTRHKGDLVPLNSSQKYDARAKLVFAVIQRLTQR